MSENWMIFGLFSSPCLYLLVTLATRPVKTEADFEFGGRRLHPSQVLDSSITYSLQIAAIFLFSVWGFQYGLWALLVPAFWLLGFVLFSTFLSRRFLERFAREATFTTMHSFIAGYGRSRSVCLVAACITLSALAGPAMYEAFTVGRTVAGSSDLFGVGAGAGIALAFLVMSVVYIMWGGFVGVVRLDRLQLAFGYGGFSAAFALALVCYSPKIGRPASFYIAFACLLASGLLLACKLSYDRATQRFLRAFGPRTTKVSRSPDWIGQLAVFVAPVVFFAAMLAVMLHEGGSEGLPRWDPALIKSTFGFTALATISLFIANGLFQFVDITQWQRLLSIAVDESALKETVAVLRGNILVGGVCGSLTWCIAVFFGVFLRLLFPEASVDPYNAVASFLVLCLHQGGQLFGLLTCIFVASLVSIMSSTVDAMVSATAFTVRNDIFATFLRRSPRTGLSRAATFTALALQLAIYLTVSQFAQGHVDAVLYVCYSFQLALLPCVAGELLGFSRTAQSKILTFAAGCAGALWPIAVGEPERAYELSPLLSALLSISAYSIGGLPKILKQPTRVP